MEERHHTTLVQALQQLPEYTPQPALWDNIALALDQEDWLDEKLSQLPVYQAPASVWEQIDQQLDQPVGNKRYHLPRWWAAAAAVIVTALGIWWVITPKATEQISMTYDQETLDMALLEADWEQDEPDIQMVVQYFQASKVKELQPGNALLETEYQELNEARAEILLMMERYGKDASLIKQLSEIERERSKVIRKMAQALSV